MLFKHFNPMFAGRLERLRDINPRNLGIQQSELYELLKSIPEYMSLDEIREALPEKYHESIDRIAASHQPPENYQLRSVLLFGIAECERSYVAGELLAEGKLEEFGKLMYVSHDGDRISTLKVGGMLKSETDHGNEYLDALISDLRGEAPDRVLSAQLLRQPGGYACSTTEADFIVDVSKSVPGVIGAQLSGAGLGGCVMVLSKSETAPELEEKLTKAYYEPRGLESGITVCVPVAGSMVVDL